MMQNILAARFALAPAMIAERASDQLAACFRAAETDAVFAKCLEARADDGEFWPAEGSWYSSLRPYSVKDGVLMVPVKGVLLHDFPYQMGSWATGYAYIRKAVERGVEDPQVRGIVLHMDSPGGTCAGLPDFADWLFSMRGRKPIRTMVDETSYSAAYWIASQTDSIVAPRMGEAGSIGALIVHVEISKMLAERGYTVTLIRGGEHKADGHSAEPLSSDTQARLQARVDQGRELFATAVSRGRGLAVEAVMATEALTYSAPEALDLGLIDEIAPIDAAMTSFVASVKPKGAFFMTVENTSAPDAAALATARAEGTAAERARISGIINSTAAATRLASAIELAFDDAALSVAAAERILAKLPEDAKPAAAEPAKPNAFNEAMAKSGNPEVGAQGTEDEKPNHVARMLANAGIKKK